MKDVVAIGLMSGTSMDGIDTTIIQTNGECIKNNFISKTIDYKKPTIKFLEKFFENFDPANIDQSFIDHANKLITYDHFLAVKKILKKNDIKPDVIGFHGQTIFHDPENKTSIQLGDGKLLSDLCKIPVVFEFRKNDILCGGQGAPIAPIYHKYLIENLKLDQPCCFLNIGGVSNLTYVHDTNLIGFDTGPGNGLIDLYMQKKFSKPFDEDGLVARKGRANFKIIKNILKNNYFMKSFPKSLDKLDFYFIFEDRDFLKLNSFDAVSTLTEFTVFSIKKSLDLLPQMPKNIILSGGGKNNKYLVSKLKSSLNLKVWIADDFDVDGDMIEAELIAYLAVRKLRKLPSTFPSTTGTKKPTICGKIFYPNN